MPETMRVSDYEVSGNIAEELEKALQTGAVPRIQLSYNVLFSGVCGEKADNHTVTLFTAVTVQGQSAVKGVVRNLDLSGIVRKADLQKKGEAKESDRAKTSTDPLGTIDLIEATLREALCELYPRFAEVLQSVVVVGYSVHGIGLGNDSHMVSASVKFQSSLRPKEAGKEKDATGQAVKCEGVDTVRASLECLITYYNWVLWRLLRRERGMVRVAGKAAPE
jgi:hypothetical protein